MEGASPKEGGPKKPMRLLNALAAEQCSAMHKMILARMYVPVEAKESPSNDTGSKR